MNSTHLLRTLLLVTVGVASAVPLLGADRTVDPTFLHRNLATVNFVDADETTSSCHYRPLFGVGDEQSAIVKGVARFGELVVDPNGRCEVVSYAAEEQIYFVLEGQGSAIYRGKPVPIRKGDFMYFAPTSEHSAANDSDSPLRMIGWENPLDSKKANRFLQRAKKRPFDARTPPFMLANRHQSAENLSIDRCRTPASLT